MLKGAKMVDEDQEILNEADTCRKYVTPGLVQAGWDDEPHSFTEQATFTDGRIIVVGDKPSRRKPKRSDYLLRYTRDIKLAVVEAKRKYMKPGDGLQQAKEYAEILGLKFAYATNGDGIVEFDYTTGLEREIDTFPSPKELWSRYCSAQRIDDEATKKRLLTPNYHIPGKTPRYYQEMEIEIPLPSLVDQRGIVARIEELAARIEEARELRRRAIEDADGIYSSALSFAFKPNDKTWKQETVADIIISMDACWSPQCGDRPASNDEWGVLKTTSVQWSDFQPKENKVLPESLIPEPKLCVEIGDVLVTRAGPRKRVGVVATVRKTVKNLMISDKLIRLRPNYSKIEPRFLELALSSPFSQEYLVRRKTGLADAQVNISQSILKSTPIVYPSISEQRSIVTYLDCLQSKLEALRCLQKETAAELDALMPSILDRAFRGEL